MDTFFPATHNAAINHGPPARRSDTWRAAGAAPHAICAGGEFLSFRLGADAYGIDILCVQEIRAYEAPTRIRHAPPCVQGVVNLRGSIVPIVDLRVLLGCARADHNACTAVLVLQVRGRLVGAVVDAVGGVLALGRDQIAPAPDMPPVAGAAFVTAIGTVADSADPGSGARRLVLLDIDNLLETLNDSTADSAGTGLVGH